jgi:hypothetical protein
MVLPILVDPVLNISISWILLDCFYKVSSYSGRTFNYNIQMLLSGSDSPALILLENITQTVRYSIEDRVSV